MIKTLTKGPEWSVLLLFALPMMIGNLLQLMYDFTDSFVVGNYIGATALAAVGVGYPVKGMMLGIIVGLGSGFGILIAQFFGAQQMHAVRRVFCMGMFWSLLFGIGMSFLGYYASTWILRDLLQVEAEVLGPATIYLQILCMGFVWLVAMGTLTGLLQGLGDSWTPMVFTGGAVVVNIVLDILFIGFFHWGVGGAAIATVIAQFAAVVGLWAWCQIKHPILHFQWCAVFEDWSVFRKGMRLSLPLALQRVLYWAGMLFVTRVVNTFGVHAMAAYAVASKIDVFVAMPGVHISIACGAFVAQNLGAQEIQRVRRGFWVSILSAMLLTVALSLVSMVFADEVIGLFSKDPGVIRVGQEYIYTATSALVLLVGMSVISNGLLRGYGHTVAGMVLSLVSLWVVRMPLVVILSSVWGTQGIWAAAPIGWAVGFLAGLVMLATPLMKQSMAKIEITSVV